MGKDIARVNSNSKIKYDFYIKNINQYTLIEKEVINNNNNEISSENIILTTPYKQESMLKNNVTNNIMEDECVQKTS